MRVLKLALACLLIGAAPSQVPLGQFQTWSASKRLPLNFAAGEVMVSVVALPCPVKPVDDGTCGFEGYNNQAAVTVSAPGMATLTVLTDRESSYARIAVVRFNQRDTRPGVIVESQSGGSGGDMTAQLLIPSGSSYRVAPLVGHDGVHLQGQLTDPPRDMSGDGRIDLKLEDGAFDSVFGCNACTPRPPILFAVKDSKSSMKAAIRHCAGFLLPRWPDWAPSACPRDAIAMAPAPPTSPMLLGPAGSRKLGQRCSAL